jgi:hypothetical protein
MEYSHLRKLKMKRKIKLKRNDIDEMEFNQEFQSTWMVDWQCLTYNYHVFQGHRESDDSF